MNILPLYLQTAVCPVKSFNGIKILRLNAKKYFLKRLILKISLKIKAMSFIILNRLKAFRKLISGDLKCNFSCHIQRFTDT